MKPFSKPAYLGDGVYAKYDGYQIELYTNIELYINDGTSRTNIIYLEPHVLINFLAYVERLKGESNETQSKV